jgi:hypothetical protein
MSIQPASDTDGDPAPPPQPAEEPPSLAQPRPLPQSVLTIDDLAFRQRATDAWRAASQLRRLMEQWRTWFYHLETSGYADPRLALRMYDAVAVCVRALCSLGVCMRTFSGTAPEELLGRFPCYPWPLKDPPWQQDEEYRRQTRALLRHEGWRPLMGELFCFLQMLETAPSVAFQPAPPSRGKPKDKAKGQRTRMSVEDANQEAMAVAGRLGQAFFLLSERKQAKQIGCSWPTWTKTKFYKTAQQKRRKVARRVAGEQGPPTRAAVSLTSSVEAVVGDGERDEVLNRLIDGERKPTGQKREWEDLSPAERQELLADQKADDEPSPLDDDRRKKVRARKRI